MLKGKGNEVAVASFIFVYFSGALYTGTNVYLMASGRYINFQKPSESGREER